MGFESLENKIEQGKEKLKELESKEIYVFHGSPELLKELEPRQSKNLDKDQGVMVEHGNPAISASPFVDIAIFRAIISDRIQAKGTKHHSAFSFGDGYDKPRFKVAPPILQKAKDAVGYVYVFNKADFTATGLMEWRSEKKLLPLRTFEVHFQDLPEDINVAQSWE